LAISIRVGNALACLRAMPADSVHCVVTSPPYWGLRDYGTPPQVWGGGWRGSLGLEPMYQLYVDHLVEVLREARRVLRPDGTLWLVIGDCRPGVAQQGQIRRQRWARWPTTTGPIGARPGHCWVLGGETSRRPAARRRRHGMPTSSVSPTAR
jgi:DNA modification methylase